MPDPTPTARTMKRLREDGWIPDRVEHELRWSATTKDLYGIIDIVAVRKGEMLLVQATSGPNVAARVSKIRESDVLPTLLSVPGVSVEVWGWRKVGPRGKPKTWDVRRVVVEQEN